MARGLSSITPILNGLTREAGLEKGMASFDLGEHWEEAVGQQIAAHTHPHEIRFTTLMILVDEAVWMHQLSFMKKEITDKVNRFLKKRPIKDIRFRIAALPSRLKTPETLPPPKHTKLSKEDAALLSQELKSVPDQDLKEAIKKAMRRHFT